jgi:hypothetical protein
MFQSARHWSPKTPRWIRGLMAGAFLAVISTTHLGCGLSYVFRNISPLHPTGWSFAWPILPSQSQRLEEDMRREETDGKVAILDPLPADGVGSACLDPPSEEEVWRKVTKFKNGSPPFYETQRNNVRFLIEKIGEKVDPCKIYPLAGPCQLVHCHYKCTVWYDELYWSDYPIPFNHVDHKVEVVYIDKDHLRRCAGPESISQPPAPLGVNPTMGGGAAPSRGSSAY